jgi:hypothetical protein
VLTGTIYKLLVIGKNAVIIIIVIAESLPLLKNSSFPIMRMIFVRENTNSI